MAEIDPLEVLSVAAMREADARTIAAGVNGFVLMRNAARGATDLLTALYPLQDTAVLVGPGNNGGDGFVIATLLTKRGWPVTVHAIEPDYRWQGDALSARQGWNGAIRPLDALDAARPGLLIDCLFGTGLSRPIEGALAAFVEALNGSARSRVAIDIPSGVNGDTGAVLGTALRCARTITFARPRPGHWLMPGRQYVGALHVIEIGLNPGVLGALHDGVALNRPALWRDVFPWPQAAGHKYSRGHAVIYGGPLAMSGAARLSAQGALRAGAGLVTVTCPPDALSVYAGQLTAIMVRPVEDTAAFAQFLRDPRLNAVLLGPGAGVNPTTREAVLRALDGGKRAVVLDADALTVFASQTERLKRAIQGPVVLTPHEGEFARLFARGESKLDAARAAAAAMGAVLVLKGADTVVAAPDGRASINTLDAPQLATAGSGDTLAGFITGLLCAGMPAYEAASCAVWLHARCAQHVGYGLIAEDLPGQVPAVLGELCRAVPAG